MTAEVLRYRALVLDRREGVEAPPEAVAAVLAEAAARAPHRALPLDAPEVAGLVARLRYLERTHPELGLPRHDPEGLLALVPTLADGRRSLAELRAADWASALLQRLDWPQRQAFDQLAPATLRVPSGAERRLDYPDAGPPVLAVRMQEMFGCTRTPTVGGARVLLHLLAPNQRPAQITDDLPGFWARTWPEVKKELRRRYPKHAWPDDPTTAEPLRGAKPRP